jgi:hypothetical protein
MKTLSLLLGATLILTLVGCRAGGPAKGPAVRILAYINVSSGCQQPTVDLLQQLADENKGKVQLELVDFGDGDVGARRWQESGHSCMTIELNGSTHVKFPAAEGEKTLTFQMPEGFMWTHDDLKAAVAAGVEGKLQPVTAEAAAASEPARQVEASVTVKPPAGTGRPAQVLLNGKPVVALYAAVEGKSPAKRAQAAALVLRSWLSAPVKPSDLATKEVTGGWALTAIDKPIATATKADAEAAKGTPRKLADAWAMAIRHIVLNAVRETE